MANLPDLRKPAARRFGRLRHGSALRDPFPTARAPRPDMPRVEILLALFNGERSLGAQFESIARQSHRAWSLSIRDDGSRDGSMAIAHAFAATMPTREIRVRAGTHRGTARNFLSLLARSDPGADYVAYCDQADIWDSGRLSRAVDALSHLPRGIPALYCGPSPETGALDGPPSFRNALVEPIAQGGTMVANRAAARILCAAAAYRGPIPAHDWWTYQVVTGCGGIVIADDRQVSSRRHHGPSGRGTDGPHRPIRQSAVGDFRRCCAQNIAALTAISPFLTPGNRAVLRDFAELRALPVAPRMKRFAASGIHCRTWTGQVVLWSAVARANI